MHFWTSKANIILLDAFLSFFVFFGVYTAFLFFIFIAFFIEVGFSIGFSDFFYLISMNFNFFMKCNHNLAQFCLYFKFFLFLLILPSAIVFVPNLLF